jgi:cyclic pyranopterin phosphate synthase
MKDSGSTSASKRRDQQQIYLRLSVTNTCNLHCSYCSPGKNISERVPTLLPLDDLVDLVEIVNDAYSVRKLRITGGEPLIRTGLTEMIAGLSNLLTAAELSLTTNGLALKRHAMDLKKAGLHRINISIDGPDSEIYRRITGGGSLQAVLEGISAARAAGFTGIKLNTVLMRQANGHLLADMVKFADENGCYLRFIEMMPISEDPESYKREYLSTREAIDILSDHFTVSGPAGSYGTATEYLLENNGSEIRIGFISSVSEPFCETCDRLRLDSIGRLYSCLRTDSMEFLPGLLQSGDRNKAIEAIRKLVETKKPPDDEWFRRSMMSIGG